MNKYSISLEKTFLNRQFRAIRVLFEGQSVHLVPKIEQPIILPVHSQPTSVKSSPVVVFEQKKPVANIANHLDIKNTSQSALPSVSIVQQLAQPKPVPSNPTAQARFGRGKWRTAVFAGVTFLCFVLLTVLFAPSVYYSLFPADPVPVKAETSGTPLGGKFASGSARVVSQVPTPDYDANLPEGTWLIIPKIGVNTQIIDTASSDEALNKGVWRVTDFGTPTDLSKPMILAAHRYGWKAWWSNGNQYWRYHSFYLLPDLVPGDIVEVISDHRKYTYEVYAGEQGEDITDYNADLILYTCKFLDSPLRFFRYARLVDPNHPVSFSKK